MLRESVLGAQQLSSSWPGSLPCPPALLRMLAPASHQQRRDALLEMQGLSPRPTELESVHRPLFEEEKLWAGSSFPPRVALRCHPRHFGENRYKL